MANARALARALVDAGFRVVSGGTDTHVMLLDVFSKGSRGKEAEQALDRARITVNKNAIPFDTNPPMNPSGIRLGSPAVTTRGFGEAEMREVGALIAEVLTNIANEEAIAGVRQQGGGAHRALPALQLEARSRPGVGWLHIVIDARRIRDFGIGTYIRSLVHALGGIDSTNQYTLVSGPADVRTLAGLPENFQSAVYARSDHSLLDHLAFPAVSARALAGPGAHSAEPRPAADDPALRGDDPRHGEPASSRRRRRTSAMQLRRFRFRRGLRRANRVIAVSARPPSATWRASMGVPRTASAASTTRPIRRSSARAGAARRQEQQRILERYQINYPFLLYAGNIRRHKNIPRLVEAFAVVREQLAAHPVYKDLRLVIIGDTISQYPAVRQAVIKSRVENVVRFLGFVPFETLRCFYESAAAFVFPSRYEGFGLPPLEAMACGTPVVTLERQFAARSGGRRGDPGESGERLRYRARHQRRAAG